MPFVQMKDTESKLLSEFDEWEKVKEAATSCMTRLPEISLSFKHASVLIDKLKEKNKELEVKLKQNKDLEVKLNQENKELEVKLKQENKDLEIKLKRENEVARAFEKKANDLSKKLDIVRADRNSRMLRRKLLTCVMPWMLFVLPGTSSRLII